MPDDIYTGPERRVPERLQATLSELAGNIDLIRLEIRSLEAKVDQRLTDSSRISEVQYQHLDAVLEQQRRENEQRRADDLQQHKDLIAAFEKQSSITQELYRKHEQEQDDRFEKIEARIQKLELAPGNRALTAAEWWRNIVVGLLVTAGLGAMIAIISAVARWDDFVKWIGGK